MVFSLFYVRFGLRNETFVEIIKLVCLHCGYYALFQSERGFDN